MYKEINDKLCIAMKDATAGSIPHEISEIFVFEENDIAFTVENEENKFKISLVKKDGSWLIDKIEEMDK